MSETVSSTTSSLALAAELAELFRMEQQCETNPVVAAGHALDRLIDLHPDHPLSFEEQRSMMAALLAEGQAQVAYFPVPLPGAMERSDRILQLAQVVSSEIVKRGDYATGSDSTTTNRTELAIRIRLIIDEQGFGLNAQEKELLVKTTLSEMVGFGPLDVLLADQSIADIMVNGPNQVFAERKGKIEETEVRFLNNDHILRVASRIVAQSGRRVDESTPYVDARLPDGSRVNVVIPPLALDAPVITIRKFPQDSLDLMALVGKGSMSLAMARYLQIAAACRFNIVISGGTGSGKTTLLNAISREASNDERIVTIEDTAELRLQQRHVVRLETRPPSVDGTGEVTMRQLLKNALRMRPDRIIIGEVRGTEVVDFLQAMNTGHDGSLSTIHANSPREAVSRLANLVALSGVNIPFEMLVAQLRDAVHLIVQVERMNDGVRRVSAITEVVGSEGGTLTMQDMFTYHHPGKSAAPSSPGNFRASGVSSAFMDRAARYGRENDLRSLLSV